MLSFFFATDSHNPVFQHSLILQFDSISSLKSGFMFALYNSALIPVLIYSVRYVPNARIAALSGIFTGVMGAAPAFCYEPNGRFSGNNKRRSTCFGN